ncbi:uncharacterized protein LOC141641552 [Silene latifolia]|uniref:uncharacterized protein LOC141641552 n=1 Tax=Silene latifolia TaxID=37657 RepID=UPI003D7767FB
MSIMSKNVCDLSKVEPLDGQNYKRWSQKLLMFFEQFEIDYVLFSYPPAAVTKIAASSVETTPPAIYVVMSNEEAIKKHDKDNKTVRFHLLNLMSNALFDLFMIHKSAKTIWELLEKKYRADDAGMKLDEIFLANVLLEKFPHSWSDYRNHLKHKKKGLSLQELVSHMRTVEANRLKDKNISVSVNASNASLKANLVESGGPSNFEKFKASHKAYQCSEKKYAEANAVTDDIIAAVVVEANLVGNVAEWVLDTGASRHLCADKGLFTEFEEVADGECVFMGNSSSASIKGKGETESKAGFENQDEPS